MRPSVYEAFKAVSIDKEGYVPWMYTDQHRVGGRPDGPLDPLVTTAIGNLIDGSKKPGVFTFNWTHGENGPSATMDEIEQAWQTVKSEGSKLSEQGIGGGDKRFAALTDLRLSHDEVMRIFDKTLNEFERRLKERFPGYDGWPADAQLGLLSMAWAMGAGFNYPRFQSAANDGALPDFDTMADESGIPGNAPRTEAQKTMFKNAAAVVAQGGDPDRVYFPGEFLAGTVKAGGVGLLGMLAGAGSLYFGMRYAKKKGWV